MSGASICVRRMGERCLLLGRSAGQGGAVIDVGRATRDFANSIQAKTDYLCTAHTRTYTHCPQWPPATCAQPAHAPYAGPLHLYCRYTATIRRADSN